MKIKKEKSENKLFKRIGSVAMASVLVASSCATALAQTTDNTNDYVYGTVNLHMLIITMVNLTQFHKTQHYNLLLMIKQNH